MEHLLLKAATTAATDEGTFEAVISAASIDREKDIVDPAGMVRALQKWVPTGKNIPLAWNHSTAAEDQIGYIDPASARVQGSEVVAKGWIDQSSEVGANAWRLVKAGTLGFSFGYLTLDSAPRKGGGRMLKELDVFEVTATPTPMNNDTRVLGWKAAARGDGMRILNSMLGQAREYIAAEPEADDTTAMQRVIDQLHALGAKESTEPDESTPEKALHIKDLTFEDLPQTVKDRCVEEAQRLLTEKSVDTPAQEPSRVRAGDPLTVKAEALALEHASGGLSLQKPPRPAKRVSPQPEPTPLWELRLREHREMMDALTGGTNA